MLLQTYVLTINCHIVYKYLVPNRNCLERSFMEIKEFICECVFQNHSKQLSSLVAERFGISRQAAQRHIKKLVDTGVLSMTGSTKAAKYALANIIDDHKRFKLTPEITEDFPWHTFVRPHLNGLPANIVSICQYGFTEMFNNAIDHSGGSSVLVSVLRTAYHLELVVRDDGIGIFNKIKHDFNLDDERHAILELSKGKLTSDPSRHSGEGIFFTSRMFDRFVIMSGKQFFSHTIEHDDWLLDVETPRKGTAVFMEIRLVSPRTTREIFDQYSTVDHPGFYRTHIPVFLAQYGDENMISRSQAKRVLARVEKFTEVVLDFKGVTEIGQAFADEIFRVFSQANPGVHLTYINANESIEWMIRRAIASSSPGFHI